jgi:hypothetical protein
MTTKKKTKIATKKKQTMPEATDIKVVDREDDDVGIILPTCEKCGVPLDDYPAIEQSREFYIGEAPFFISEPDEVTLHRRRVSFTTGDPFWLVQWRFLDRPVGHILQVDDIADKIQDLLSAILNNDYCWSLNDKLRRSATRHFMQWTRLELTKFMVDLWDGSYTKKCEASWPIWSRLFSGEIVGGEDNPE